MRSLCLLALAALMLLALPARLSAEEAQFKPLFDGKTLDGWEGNLHVFRIEDGSVVGGSMQKALPNNEFLCTKKQYGNFELRLKFKLLGGKSANAGVQIRTRRIPNHHDVIGYQADMAEGLWGVLYEEGGRGKLAGPPKEEIGKPVKHGEWNDYRIRCQGNHVQLWINGQQTVDYTEKDPAIPRTGIIGLQIHGGPPSEAWYKDIVIQELPRDGKENLKKPAANGQGQPMSDADRIKGHWILVDLQGAGETPGKKPVGHYVFTDKELKMTGEEGGVGLEFKLDAAKDPKQIDLRWIPLDRGPLGIYRFEGERLRMCWAMKEGSSRPSEFAPKTENGWLVLLLEKAKQDGSNAPTMKKIGYQRADAKVTGELRQTVAEGIELLEAKKYDSFLERFVAPAERQQWDARRRAETRDRIAKNSPPFIGILHSIEEQTPMVDAAGTEAVFDLRGIHVNGAPKLPEMRFTRVGGKWYGRNK